MQNIFETINSPIDEISLSFIDESFSQADAFNSIEGSGTSLVFVDSDVEYSQEFIDEATLSADVFLLNDTSDGLSQISEVLANYGNVSSLHIISHGSDNSLQLGSTQLSLGTLDAYRDELTGWTESLSDDADILLHGCYLAAGTDGKALVQELGALTGADIAASEDLTGNRALGGNWDFEYVTGEIEEVSILSSSVTSSFDGLLALPQNGIVFHIEGDTGVTTTGGDIITLVEDQSALGNDLTSTGDPRLIPGALNGHNVIRFDGAGDSLQRTLALNNLPAGNADRSVFIVASYNSNGYGGFAYGDDDLNQTFGLIVDPQGDLAVQGWGGSNDKRTNVDGTGQGWITQAAILDSGTLEHYKNGGLIDTEIHTFNTDLQQIVLGAEIDGTPFLNMDVAEVIIYDRALSETERQDVQEFLSQKYDLTTTSTNDYVVQTDPNFVNEQVIGGLNQPIDSISLPSGELLILEKGGVIKITDPQAANPIDSNYLTLANVNSGQERGLTSIALDPNFETNGFLYVYYSHDTDPNSDGRFRISRFVHDVDHAHIEEEKVIWESNEDIFDCCHYGGSFGFGPDGYLYLATGDVFDDPATAQELDHSGGKIIRLDPSAVDGPGGEWVRGGNNDHLIPDDNPFIDGPGGNLDEIWAYGLRNPFRGGWDLTSGRFYIGEVGGNVQATAQEDIHVATVNDAGANFGWNFVEGISGNPAYSDPIFTYDHSAPTPNGGAIVGGTVYRDNLFPSEFDGAYFFADYVQGWIRYLKFDNAGNVIDADQSTPEIDAFNFDNSIGGLVSLRQGPEGALYYTDLFSGELRRVTYNSSGNLAPVIDQASADNTSGGAPLEVNFMGSATDPENDPLEYLWDFGDGNTSTEANPTHTYAATGPYVATLTVSDPTQSTTSSPINISVGQAPEATILTPTNNGLFRAGDTITVTATASDDGQLNENSYEWDVRFIHNAHFHTELDNQIGSSFNFEIPSTGHDFSDTTGFEFVLTVTDADGLTDTEIISIFPEKVDLTFTSNVPGGVTFMLDGLPRTGDFTHDTAINFEHVISTPQAVTLGGVQYQFASWSNGVTNNSQTITVPEMNQTLTANYTNVGAPVLPTGLVLQLDGDTGVTATGDLVTGWADQSGSGNNLTGAGDPRLVTGALNGHNVIRFDGVGDKLERLAALNGLPEGNGDRTVFVVANYNSAGYGGFAYGDNQNNQAFGLIVDPDGELAVQAWGRNDRLTNVLATGQGWLTQSAVLNAGTLNHYKDGTLIDTVQRAYNTDLQKLVVGAEIDSTPFLDMDVAEILVFDRALSESERQQVDAYLQGKYFSGGGNQAPDAVDDTLGVEADSTNNVVNVLANDTDPDTGDTLAITGVGAGSNGGAVTINGTNDGLLYTPATGFTGTETFTYTIDDGNGGGDTATVTATVGTTGSGGLITDGLVLQLDGDTGVTATGDLVTGWTDQSGSGNNLTGAGDPRLVTGALNGHNVIRFDGVGDKLERLAALNGLPEGNGDRTVFVVANYNSAGYGGFAYGDNQNNQAFGLIVDPDGELAVQAWGRNDRLTNVLATGQGWLTQSAVLNAGTLNHYKDGTLIDTVQRAYNTDLQKLVVGAEIDSTPFLDMDVAEILVFDRALSESERQQVDAYLQGKYFSGGGNQANDPIDFSDYTVELVNNRPLRVLQDGFSFDATDVGGPEPHFHLPGMPTFLTQHNVGGNGTQINFTFSREDGAAFTFERFSYTSGLHFNGDVNAGFTVIGTKVDGTEVSNTFGPATTMDVFQPVDLDSQVWQNLVSVRFIGDRIALATTITQELNLDDFVVS